MFLPSLAVDIDLGSMMCKGNSCSFYQWFV